MYVACVRCFRNNTLSFNYRKMKLGLVKQLDNSFKSAFDSDYNYINKLKQGEIYFFEVVRERNIGFHRKFFALIKMVFENQERYKLSEDLREDLLIEAGYFRTIITIHGEERKKAKSISFGKMSQDEFDKMYADVVEEVHKYFHFDKELIKENIERHF